MNFLKKRRPEGAVVVALAVKMAHPLVCLWYRQVWSATSDPLSFMSRRNLNEVIAMAKRQKIFCVLIPDSQPTGAVVALATAYLLSACPELEGRIIDPGVNHILGKMPRVDLARFTANQFQCEHWKLL